MTRPAGTDLILGIDPGTSVTGWGLVIRKGARLAVRGYGAWRPPRDLERGPKLAWIGGRLEASLEEFEPTAVALEQAFLGKNIQSALRLGEVRGVILAVCGRRSIPVVEYPTATVKKAVVGNGRADKSQVQFMLQRLLNLAEPPEPADAGDALALAYALALDYRFGERVAGR